MMMASEEVSNSHQLPEGDHDVCRVCRCEASPDRPLFFPCLCSGSIKFVHQDCLVEWLKVSRKKYCELCKHEYTFESLYKVETPSRMPVLVYIVGVANQIGTFLQGIARYCMVSTTWVVLLPWMTSCLVKFVFGKSTFRLMLATRQLDLFVEESSLLTILEVILDITQGIFTTCAFAFAILLSVVLKEYILGIGFWQRLEESLNPPAHTNTTEPVVNQPVTPAVQTVEDARSEAGSVVSVDGVTAREYRAYMRRQRLYRDRLEREQARLRGISSSTPENNDDGSVTESNQQGEDQSILSPSRPSNALRDFRCRICGSHLCVSMEHVRLASHRQRVAAQQARQEQEAGGEGPVGEQQATQTAPQPHAQPPEEIVIIVSTNEAFGLTGPIWHLFRNALIILACNFAFLSVSIGLPYLVGWTLLQGFMWNIVGLFIGLGCDFVERSVLLMTGKVIGLELSIPNHVLHIYHRSIYKTRMFFKRLDTTPPYPSTLKSTFLSLILGYTAIVLLAWTFVLVVLCRERKHRLTNPPRPFSPFVSCAICIAAFFKIACMTMLEMIAFPVMAGHLLDACLLPLIDGTPWTRLSFALSYPLTSFATHWTLGILFMLYVSMQVGRMRSLMRPGVLYFLRDPNDPEFRPFREMLERSFSAQLSRIGKSALLYAMCCCGLIGVFAKSIRWLFPTFHNVHLNFTDPVTEIPLDLLLHTFLRTTIDSIQPQTTSRFLALTITHTSRLLRLSSFIRGGGRYCGEESFTGRWQWVPALNRAYPPDRLVEMAERSVEPLDIAKLAIIEGRALQQDVASMAAAMAQTEQESTANLRQRRSRSHHPALQTTRPSPVNTTTGFVVVYKPERFAGRVCVLVTALWLNFLASLFVTCFAPVCLGRYLMSIWLHRPVHEVYTWTLGAFVMICTSRIISSTCNLISQLDASSTRRIVVEWPAAALKALLLTLTTMLLWPTLIGIYVNALAWPIMSSPQQVPIVFSIPTIVFGIPILRLLYLTRAHFLPSNALALIDSLNSPAAFFTFPLKSMLRHVLLPYTALLLVLLLAPPLSVILICPLLNMSTAQILLLQRWSILASLLVPLLYSLCRAIAYTHNQMRQRIWEETYTLGQQLRNLNDR